MLTRFVIFAGLGVAILIAAWLPLALRNRALSLPIVAVALGAALEAILGSGNFPLPPRDLTERLTEYALIVSIMGAGLKIDRPFGWRRWANAWRLLLVVMPLSIGATALIGHALLGLPLAIAILLGGMLAPTDPVLAASVQTGPPGSGEDDEVRVSLTAEAGLNDGLAFPFVNLGLLLLAQGADPAGWLQHWLLVDVLWRIAAAVGIGLGLGWVLIRFDGKLPEAYRLPQTHEGIVSVGLTFLAYGLTQLAGGYGFVAVFVTAATLRNLGRSIEFAQELDSFAEQTERAATFLVLAVFGASITAGLLEPLGRADILFAALVLLVVRPLASFLGLLGSAQPLVVRLAMGYFGIRGLASLFYAGYVTSEADLANPDHLWAIVGLVVLASVVLYGLSAKAVMRRLSKLCHQRAPDAEPSSSSLRN